MKSEKIKRVNEIGQSFWLDYIRRDLLENGQLQRLVEEEGISGLTSNPSIFNKAIAETDLYDETIDELSRSGLSCKEIYEHIAIEDLRLAADLLRATYDASGGEDGYVSLEVSPSLAYDAEGTVEEAKSLFSRVERKNLFIKVPATEEGLKAIEELISFGINVNVTLLFSIERYEKVEEAYQRGLARRLKKGADLSEVASVASFFVSRVDTAMDEVISSHHRDESLLGKTAIANAKLAYQSALNAWSKGAFKELQAHGARKQRVLWASTSTKNEDYRDVRYVEELIGPDTVNTMPLQTLELFLDHGVVEERLTKALDQARAQMNSLESSGLSLQKVSNELEEAGVKSFAQAFNSMIESIENKVRKL